MKKRIITAFAAMAFTTLTSVCMAAEPETITVTLITNDSEGGLTPTTSNVSGVWEIKYSQVKEEGSVDYTDTYTLYANGTMSLVYTNKLNGDFGYIMCKIKTTGTWKLNDGILVITNKNDGKVIKTDSNPSSRLKAMFSSANSAMRWSDWEQSVKETANGMLDAHECNTGQESQNAYKISYIDGTKITLNSISMTGVVSEEGMTLTRIGNAPVLKKTTTTQRKTTTVKKGTTVKKSTATRKTTTTRKK